jgi:hypothetical protein
MNDRDIEINGLTPEQVQMLDMMWSIESYQDYEDWLDSITLEEAYMAEQLKNLLVLTLIDDAMEDYDMAKNYLKKFQLK